MKKYFFSALLLTIVSGVTFGQTTQSKVEQAKNDPQAAQNAAKADTRVAPTKTTVSSNPAITTEALKKLKPNKTKRKNKSTHSSR